MPQSSNLPLRFRAPSTALALWRSALDEEIGIRFAVDPNDYERLRYEMYKARSTVVESEPELGDLQLLVAPGQTEMWIVRRTVEVE